MKTLHLVHLNGISILEQLQLEEALLRADQHNWCLLNVGAPPAIVMGISGKPEQLIHASRFSAAPVPLVRRFSGGGTVFIDEHTYFITLICQREVTPLICCPKKILEWSADLYRPAFEKRAFSLQDNDYVLHDKKFGGNAQYLCKDRWLLHSSLLWDFLAERMQYLLFPPKVPAYRGKRSHEEFLCRLRDHYPTVNDLQQQLIHALQKRFEIREVSLKKAKEALVRPHRSATHLVSECT